MDLILQAHHGSRPFRGPLDLTYGPRARRRSRAPHRPTRLSPELEEVDAAVPLPPAVRPRGPSWQPPGLARRIAMIIFCGLDVHKRLVEACLVDASGQV